MLRDQVIHRAALGWDFVADEKPTPNPEGDHWSWLDTSDMTEYAWDSSIPAWVDVGGTHMIHVSGPDSQAVGLGRFHAIVQNGSGKVWRPYQDMLLTAMWTFSDNNPSVNYGVILRDNASALATIGFGSGSEVKTFSTVVTANSNINFWCIEFFTTSPFTIPDRWSVGAHFKRIVQ